MLKSENGEDFFPSSFACLGAYCLPSPSDPPRRARAELHLQISAAPRAHEIQSPPTFSLRIFGGRARAARREGGGGRGSSALAVPLLPRRASERGGASESPRRASGGGGVSSRHLFALMKERNKGD